VPDAPTSAATLITPRADEEDPRALAQRIVAEVLEHHGVAAPAAQRAAAVAPDVSPPSAVEAPDEPVHDASTAPARDGSPVGAVRPTDVEDEASVSESVRLARSIVTDVLAERGLTRSGAAVDDVGPPSHPSAHDGAPADEVAADGLAVAVADVAVHVPSAPADEPHDWTEPLFADTVEAEPEASHEDDASAEPAGELGPEASADAPEAAPAIDEDRAEAAVVEDGAEAAVVEVADGSAPGSLGAVPDADGVLDDAEDAAETHEVEGGTAADADLAVVDTAVEELDPDDPAAIARRLVAETLAAAAERAAEDDTEDDDVEATAALTADATTPLETVDDPTAPLLVEDEPTAATDVRAEVEDTSAGETHAVAAGDPWGDEPWAEGPGEGLEDGPPPVPSHVHDEWRWSSTDDEAIPEAAVPGSVASEPSTPAAVAADADDRGAPDADSRVDLAALPPPEPASASLLRSLASADPDPATPEGPRTGRWLLVTLLGAIGLALLLPLTIRALGTLLTLN
jgi:hypothetical protein